MFVLKLENQEDFYVELRKAGKRRGSLLIFLISPLEGRVQDKDWKRSGFLFILFVGNVPKKICGHIDNHETAGVIEVRNLTKTFPDKKRGVISAVGGVSFTAKPGQIYGLLGANGAGKTTILRVLATLLKPTSGTAVIDGVDISRDPEGARAKLGFLAVSTALYGRLSAEEMISYFGKLYGLGGAFLESRIAEIAVRLGMTDFMNQRCDTLSTGMKQKVSVARTLIHDPAVLIFDEPTIGLDVMTSRTIVKFIRESRERGRTVIYSSHVMSEVEQMCDVIGILHGGKLLAEGTMDQLHAEHGAMSLEELFLKVVRGAE